MGLFGRKRMKTTDAQGRKVVVVTDKRGTVRKTKIKDKKNQITTKERYDRAGNLTKRKAKGKYIKRFKAKTSNPTFDQSVFQDNQTVRNMVSGNPILNAKRNDLINNGTPEQKKVQNTQVVNDNTQPKKEETTTTTTTNPENKTVPTDNIEKKDTPKKEKSFGEAYREQRDKNTEAGVDHYGDEAGYFTWKGKKYNTESKSEKANRLKPKKTDVIKTDPPADSGKSEPTPPAETPPDTPPTTDKDGSGSSEKTSEGNEGTPPNLPTTPPIVGPDYEPMYDDSKKNSTVYNEQDGRSVTGAKRGGSRGSYRSYKHGGAVGPNGIL
jgi:hypothetical protein